MQKNMFIVLEGLDGSGKTTIINKIIQPILPATTVYTREPGGTVISEKIRDLIMNTYPNEILSPLSELLLFYASRAQHLTSLINPALMNGLNVVCDRFHWSTIAYQNGGNRMNLDLLENIQKIIPEPYLNPVILYCNVSVKTALQRIKKSHKSSKYDLKDLEFFTRVRNSYMALIRSSNERCYIVNAEQNLDLINTQVVNIMKSL